MNEQDPVIIHSQESYLQNFTMRVRENTMQAHTPYRLMSKINNHDIYEFQATIEQIIHHSLGKASLTLCLFDADDSPFYTVQTDSQEGILGASNRPIYFNEYGQLGKMTEGYLLNGTETEPAQAVHTPLTFDTRALPRHPSWHPSVIEHETTKITSP